MHKDEIVLNSTKKMNNKFAHDATTKAYPMVLTTVGDMHAGTIQYLTDLYSKPSPMDFYKHVQLINNNDTHVIIIVIIIDSSCEKSEGILGAPYLGPPLL